MYYKDDFYKEFRTEKELCEYLEEIDSRAEWIRITSKKLKVAAAGEETCTEVPGISLEALEKDTLSHSRLVLILPERICYIGNSAIKSLKGRARIDGKALADVDKKTLAEILNKCLKVARGRALIRFCEGKIRAVLSGDEKDYAIISMPDMYMVTSAYIHGDYEKATFLNGYADHYSVTASWQLEDTKLTDVYKELMQNYGRKTDKDIKAVVRITTSDVGVSGANIFYSLQEPTSEPEASQTPEPDSQKEDTQKGDTDPEDGSTGEDNDSSKDNTIHYDKNGDQDDDSRKETPDQDDNRNQDGAQVPLSATPTPSPEPEPTQEPEEDHYPTIATDLTDGETVNAAYRTFYVQAVDWYGNSLSSTALEVYGNGERLSSKGEPSPGILAYRLDLNEGSNTVDIKATDDEGWSTTLPTFTIYKGDESQEEPAGSITVSIEAGTVGLGTILPATSIDFYQGEQLSSVVLRLLQNSGFDWRNDGSATGGFYLKAIGRGGITSGASIPDDLMAHLTEVNCQLSGHDANWLGEFDFTMNSGWMYFVNGEYMNIGMSGYFPADGDEVRLRFTLYSGADLGVGDNGEVWGDW